MNSSVSFEPNWSSPPGRTISDVLKERSITIAQFSKLTSLSISRSKNLLLGVQPLSRDVAQKLELIVGGSVNFWMQRETQYREDLKRSQNIIAEKSEWISKFPLQDMRKFGWINSSRSLKDKESSLLSFFGVKSIDHWYKLYHDLNMEVSFRTSSTFDSVPESVIAWIRQCEIESESLNCAPWDSLKFSQVLDVIRPLTREKDPCVFLPQVQSLLAQCGVALIVNPLPKRCYASGATYFQTSEKALMLLSFRHMSDDHFWFTFFHEAGHLLLHENTRIFLESKNNSDITEEHEANLFSENYLIPENFKSELNSFNAKDWKKIIRFAKKIGISPGIVVGQLQHSNIVRYDQLNKLKTRYKWNK
jgi:HTH-type transcriptional regulator/antitoxin HigA